MVGNGARAAGVEASIKEFAEKIGIPMSLTWPTADLLDFNHRLNAGRIGNVAKRFSNIIIQNADFLVIFGSRLDPVLTAYDVDRFGINAKILIIDIEQAELDKLPDRFIKLCKDLREVVPRIFDDTLSLGLSINFTVWQDEIKKFKDK